MGRRPLRDPLAFDLREDWMLETLTIQQETRAIDWPEDVSRMKAVLEAHG